MGDFQNRVEFLMTDHALFFGHKAALPAAGEIAPVMHNADIIRLHIMRSPIQAGQLTKADIFSEIFSPVLSDLRMQCTAHLDRNSI